MIRLLRESVRHENKHTLASKRVFPDAPLPLRWSHPWQKWHFLSWSLTTFSAPTVWVTTILLLINARSDHPFFWISLPLIVALSNAVTIFHINQRHRRAAFNSKALLALHYVGISMGIGCTCFLLTGTMSGLLGDLGGTNSDTLTKVVWSLVLTGVFGTLSFVHAGTTHAWLVFHDDARSSDSIPIKDRGITL